MKTASNGFTLAGHNAKLENQEILGEEVFWSIHSQRRPTEAVERKMEQLGLDPRVLDKTTEKANFINAVITVAKKYDNRAEKILDDTTHIVFKIISASPDKVETKMKYDQHTTVSFNKQAKMVSGEGKEDLITEIRATFTDFLDSVCDGNFRNTIRRLLDDTCSAITLRPTGGIYFVVKEHLDTVDKLSQLTEELGMGTIFTLRIPCDEREKKVVLVSAKEDCEGRLDLLDKEVDAMTTRISSLENASERAKKVKDLYDMLCKTFDFEVEADSLVKKYKALEEKITSKIEEFSETKSTKKAEKKVKKA